MSFAGLIPPETRRDTPVDPMEKRSFCCRRVMRGDHVRPARLGMAASCEAVFFKLFLLGCLLATVKRSRTSRLRTLRRGVSMLRRTGTVQTPQVAKKSGDLSATVQVLMADVFFWYYDLVRSCLQAPCVLGNCL